MNKLLFIVLVTLLPSIVSAQLNYPKYGQLSIWIDQLSKNSLVEKSTLGKSFAGENIPLLKIQSGTSIKPTLLIVAGVDGKHPAGVINALKIVENILKKSNDSLQTILQDKSIWVVPVLNIDAYKRNVEAMLWESGNARVIDNDRDGRIDENPLKDLNGDGLISQMRVKSAIGKYKANADQPNYLILSDPSKGEKGEYELFVEGIDDDFDGLFGEDGSSGVNLDKNFPFDYPFFEPESGAYAASEPETKAIMDLIFNNAQIATVLHLGLQNNLSYPESFDSRKASERIIKSWNNDDVKVSAFISQLYNKEVKKLGEAPKLSHSKGNFSNTVYYHAGRFSLVTPSWWTPETKDSVDVNKGKAQKKDDKFLKWVTANNIPNAILPWEKVNHPNFPNQEVEVGGVVEIFRNNPPLEYLEESGVYHANFVLNLLSAMAQLEFGTPVVTNLGEDIFRVEIKVMNTGDIPTYPVIADRIKMVSKMRTILELQKNQQFVNGKRLQLHRSLASGESQVYSWLVKGKGKLSLTVGCPTAGEKTIDISL